MLKSAWGRRFLILLSLAGFLWQVFIVSIEYFGYKTTTSVAFRVLPQVKPQLSVFCVRYWEVMDRKMITKETGIKFSRKRARESDDHDKRLTVEQIFKYTPHPDKVIKSCVVPGEHGHVRSDSTKCGQHFTVSKYFTQEYICYRFARNRKDTFPIEEITHSTRNSFLVHEILLTQEFREASVVEAIVHPDSGGYPFHSRNYAAKHVIKVDHTSSSNDPNYLFLSGSNIVIDKLPKPYDTACIHASNRAVNDCNFICKYNLYLTINRAPGVRDTPLSLPIENG